MNTFLGEIAAFGIIFLVFILFVIFLRETRLIKDRKSYSRFRDISLFTVFFGFAYLLLGGLVYNYSVKAASIMDFKAVWGFGSIADVMNGLFNAPLSDPFNFVYTKIVGFVGYLLLGQYLPTAFYMSFLFTILFVWFAYLIFKKILREKEASYMVFLILAFPMSYRLFLPSSLSLLCFLVSMIIYLAIRKSNISMLGYIKKFSWENYWAKIIFVLAATINGFFLMSDIIIRS